MLVVDTQLPSRLGIDREAPPIYALGVRSRLPDARACVPVVVRDERVSERRAQHRCLLLSAATVILAKRRSLRRVAVREMYGLSLSTIDRLVKVGEIRSRRVGGSLLLNASDCEKAFGWPDDSAVEPSPRDMAEMRKLVG